MRSQCNAAGGAILALALLPFAPAAIAGAAEVTRDAAGVEHVRNGAAPRDGVRDMQLTELWRRGGEDDDEVLFGVIAQVLVDPAGNVYLLDMQLSQVQVFAPDGRFLRTLSREGEGPGEVRQPADMFMTDDGRLGLGVLFPGRVVYVTLEGEPAGTLAPGGGDPGRGGFSILRGCRFGGGRTVLAVTNVAQNAADGYQTRSPHIASYDAGGVELHVFHDSSYRLVFNEQVFREETLIDVPLRRFCVAGDGSVYVAPDRERYRIEVYRPDGRLARVIEREYPVHRRSAAELATWTELFTASVRNQAPGFRWDVCATEPPIDWVFGGLWEHADGRLWVRNSRSAIDQPAGCLSTYDVFDADGVFAEQVRVRCPGDPVEDKLFFAGADRVIQVTRYIDAVRTMMGGGAAGSGDEAAPMEVVCYRVEH